MSRQKQRQRGYLQEAPWLTEDELVEEIRRKAAEKGKTPGELFREVQRKGLKKL